MKKIILLVVVLAIFTQGTHLFAQNSSSVRDESGFYFFTVPIEKIYLYRLGYIVLYRTNSNRIAQTYIPHEWFSKMGGPGELIYLYSGTEWPTLTVYYEYGEFSHVRLRLRKERLHAIWRAVPQAENLDAHFIDVKEIKLEF